MLFIYIDNQHTVIRIFFFFNDTATTEIYTLSLHDALPIYFYLSNTFVKLQSEKINIEYPLLFPIDFALKSSLKQYRELIRSEEHTSELQSRQYLVCRLLLEKKKKISKEPSYKYNSSNSIHT